MSRIHDPPPFLVCILPWLHTHTQVDTKGVSGERVIDSMKNRLDTILSKQSYNWIIILGGEVHTVMLSTECFQNINMLSEARVLGI